jgi:hypothetical protein
MLTSVAACGSRTPLFTTTTFAESAEAGPDAGPDSTRPPPDAPPVYYDAASLECSPPPLGPPVATWAISTSPTAGSLLADVYAVTVAPDGTVFAAGYGALSNDASCTYGGGPSFLAKIDPNGQVLFEQQFTDGINDPLVVALVPDDQGGVIVGLEDDEGTNLGAGAAGVLPYGCVVERLDATLEPHFAHALPGADCVTAFAFAADPLGNSLIATSCGTSPLCNGNDGSLLVRLDAKGGVLATRIISAAPMSVGILAAALQTDGTILIGGYGTGPVDFGMGPVDLGTSSVFFATYDSMLDGQDLISSPDSGDELQAIPTLDGTGFVVAGDLDRPGVDLGGGPLTYSGHNQEEGGPNVDVFLAELTTQLGHVFSHGYGDQTSQGTTSLCTAPDGTIGWAGVAGMETVFGQGQLVSGAPNTGQDGFITTFSASGQPLAAVSTETTVHAMNCSGGSYVIGGLLSDGPLDLGGGVTPNGGFIVKRAKP